MEKFSVLMSLYYKEKPEYFRQCIESVLSQTVLPSQIVIVKDGPLNQGLEDVLGCYISKKPKLYTILPLEKNLGLGLALAKGILCCKYELVARVDTDDISRKDRFEKQLKMFSDNPNLDICGSHILEFEGNINKIISKRCVPIVHQDISEYQKRRSAFNHMTVMYKKSSVIKAGNYEHCPLMEDDMLWIKMLLSGAIGANIDDYLVYARTGYAMIKRRGGLDYFLKYKKARKQIYQTNYISAYDYYISLFAQGIVSLLPKEIRKFIFLHLLR